MSQSIASDLKILSPLAAVVARGLAQVPKSLPPKLFYDAEGSSLFQRITRLPEYYLTRAELEILEQRASEIARRLAKGVSVVELGSGTALKTSTFLQALTEWQTEVHYAPVDISSAALAKARERVEALGPKVRVQPLLVDFTEDLGFLREIESPKLVLYLGSSIGNFDPGAAATMLAEVRNELEAEDELLLGTDLAKDPVFLIPAYNDSQGVTADFNKNILGRINRELEADFNLDSFRHIALWNAKLSRMEMYLESVGEQSVSIQALQLKVTFQAGERIHTENSYKFTLPMVRELFDEAGWKLEKTWFDRRQWYALHLARA